MRASEAVPPFIPLPGKIDIAEGRCRLSSCSPIKAPASLRNEAAYLAAKLALVAGKPSPGRRPGEITLALDESLPAEGYDLLVTRAGATVRGGSAAGVFYGVQTLLQSLVATPEDDCQSPCLHIADAPAMPWRGVMLDSARHFQPKAFILKFLDAMAAYKLNRFHWHLTDSEAWRPEIRRYPKLALYAQKSPAYYPDEIPTNPSIRPKYRYGMPHGGGYYSQGDIREIVAYAAARHIVIIPEIGFPAHADAALHAYPGISATRAAPDFSVTHRHGLWGVQPEAREFLKNVLDEIADLFPGKWIHLGGDEAFRYSGPVWKNNPDVRAYLGEERLGVFEKRGGFAAEHAVHLALFNEMAAHIAKRGRVALGWEEIAHGDNLAALDGSAVAMTWLDRKEIARLAGAGRDIVMADGFSLYLDSLQSRRLGEPAALYTDPFTAEAIRDFDFFPTTLPPEAKSHILGGQVSIWTEFMPRTDDVEYQAFPRVCAFAEAAWTPPAVRKASADFPQRLEKNNARLDAMGMNHRRFSSGN